MFFFILIIQEKKKSMFEFTKVLTVMNNNFENQIIEGAKVYIQIPLFAYI